MGAPANRERSEETRRFHDLTIVLGAAAARSADAGTFRSEVYKMTQRIAGLSDKLPNSAGQVENVVEIGAEQDRFAVLVGNIL